MKPGTVFIVVGRSVEENDFALVPSLIAFSDVGQIETGDSVRRIGADPRDASLVTFPAVSRIRLVPNVYRRLFTLIR